MTCCCMRRQTNPIPTKCITSMILVGISDLLSQLITRWSIGSEVPTRSPNPVETQSPVSPLGLLVRRDRSLVHHAHQQSDPKERSLFYLPESGCGSSMSGCSLIEIVDLVAPHQCCVLFLHCIFRGTSLFRLLPQNPRAQPEMGLKRVRQNLLPTMKINVVIWIPIQAINFLFVPPMVHISQLLTCSIS